MPTQAEFDADLAILNTKITQWHEAEIQNQKALLALNAQHDEELSALQAQHHEEIAC
jgi:hypothetical protein